MFVRIKVNKESLETWVEDDPEVTVQVKETAAYYLIEVSKPDPDPSLNIINGNYNFSSER